MFPMNNFPIQPHAPIQTPQEGRSPKPERVVPSTQECPVTQHPEIAVPQVRQGASALQPHAITSSLTSRNISQAPAEESRAPMTDVVKHALEGLKDAGLDPQQWQGIGLFLEVPYDRIKSIDTNPALNNPESKLCELLTYAETSNLLLPERLVQAFSELMDRALYEEYTNNLHALLGSLFSFEFVANSKKEITTKAQRFFDCEYLSPEPECYNNDNLSWHDRISARDAYLIINKHMNVAERYFLAARLNLPDADREALLPLLFGEWNAYFAELLWRADEQNLLTFANLCAVMSEGGDRWSVEKYVCPRLGLDYHQLPAYQSKKMLSENSRNPDRLLSIRDLVSIFCDQMLINPEYLAQVSGYSELLEHPLMRTIQKKIKLCPDSVKRIILLELIYQQNRQKNKDGLSITDVVRILNKPEVMEFRVANQLMNKKAAEGADHVSPEFTMSQRFDLAKMLIQIPDFEAEPLAKMLGLPNHKRKLILSGEYAKELHIIVYDILCAANSLGRLTPENVLYALNQACPASVVDRVCNMSEFPQLQAITGAPLPPLVVGQQDDIPRKSGSMPLTMELLGNLLLSHNVHRIGMCMGLRFNELIMLQIRTDDKPQAMAYRLSKKLTETERGLETGHLYQALQWLDDEDALAYFPQQQTDEFLSCLPEQTVNNIQQGMAYISAFSQIPATVNEAEWILPIVSKIGLPRWKFDLTPVSCDPGWNLIRYLLKARESPSPQRIKELVEWSGRLQLAKDLLSESGNGEPSAYHCPISGSLISWPAAIDKKQNQCGPQTVYFERDMLFEWVNKYTTHPLTSEALDVKQIRTDCPEFFEQLIATLNGQSDNSSSHHKK
ncbi:hypothetical protein [Endozoicomonas sp. SCSIO W0465]|uniref:hypothetical protein n=1 Tax=Endozoicomonas sp. SCSIO W0465 TaxID=2918516 RepID=UPI002075E5F1|nr:hypothetical protein [Endozoicomonas sp. SCSIO W0465]USE36960.1 hypothetical protein MJO57_01585 [Endozoicomonas sp. SCSIO W0465]